MQTAAFSSIILCRRERALVPSSSCEVVHPIMGPHPHDLFCSQLPSKGPIFSTITLGVRMSTYGLSAQFSPLITSYSYSCNPMNHSTPDLPVITNSQSLPNLISVKSMIPPNHLILCRPLLLLPSIFPSIRVFSNESASHQVAKVLEFQLQHQSFQ